MLFTRFLELFDYSSIRRAGDFAMTLSRRNACLWHYKCSIFQDLSNDILHAAPGPLNRKL